MNNQFDELTKSLGQSVTRRAALKKFGPGGVGMALACFGLANRAQGQSPHYCQNTKDCAQLGESYVCCQDVFSSGEKVCVLHKSYCSYGKVIWV